MSEPNDITGSPTNQKSGRKVLFILAIVFVLPFTVAATLHLLNLKPSGHSYGELIHPARSLQFPSLHDDENKDFTAQQWLKKWTVLTVNTSCDQACQSQVHLLKQVHTSLGKEVKRVQRVMLVPADMQNETFDALQKQYPDLIILAGADAETMKFAEQFGLSDQPAGQVYLVDPLGNLMMRYPENLDPKGMRKDLLRLLKNSWAG